MMPEETAKLVVTSGGLHHPKTKELTVSKMKEEHRHTPEQERLIREAAMDETIAETFPASDPPSTIPNPDEDEALERKNGPLP